MIHCNSYLNNITYFRYMKTGKIFVTILLILLPGFIQAKPYLEQKILNDRIFSESIKTIELYQKGWRMSYPYLRLESNNTLCLDFDDLSEETNTYYYTFIHCDAHWKPSDISETDYLEGYTENEITDYKNSVNTTVPYTHYHVSFPNENVHFTLTGNYVILVYKEMDREKPVLTARFMVYTTGVDIDGKVIPPAGPDRTKDQELLLSVDYSNYPVQSPRDELYVVVRQNGRWDNALFGIRPSRAENRKLIYDHVSGLVFHGENEFRNFDIKSIRYQSQHIDKIEYIAPYYNIRLKPDAMRSMEPYFSDKDLNGKFYIKNSLGTDPDTDADYLNVYFSLPSNFPFDEEVYITGALTGWSYTKSSRLTYHLDIHRYVGTLLLKQGYYNYAYAVKSPGQDRGDLTRIEGSHFETENDYTILVYHRSSFERYDQLVGVKIINNGTDR